MTPISGQAPCPCGSRSAPYEQCCARFIEGGELPDTAQQLMRSRYTAYVLRNDDYLRATWHESTCPAGERLSEPDVKWLGLEIKRHGPLGDQTEVEFVARYRIAGRAFRLHETSRFVKEGGRWLYLDGRLHEKK